MRSRWKPFVFKKSFILNKSLANKGKLFVRNLVFLFEYPLSFIKIYNGCTFKKLNFKDNYYGLKFGSFIFTKKRALFTKKRRK